MIVDFRVSGADDLDTFRFGLCAVGLVVCPDVGGDGLNFPCDGKGAVGLYGVRVIIIDMVFVHRPVNLGFLVTKYRAAVANEFSVCVFVASIDFQNVHKGFFDGVISEFKLRVGDDF